MSLLEPGDSVLELGCGYGRVAHRLALAARRVVGIDTARESLELAGTLRGSISGCEFLEMDAAALDFEDDCFDAVVCVQNGICAFGADRAKLLEEALRVVRPDGLVVFSSYADAFWPWRLEWFEDQSRQGLIGELDRDACRDGVIVCRDGFRAESLDPSGFRRLCAQLGVAPQIDVVDESSVFCRIRNDSACRAGSLIVRTVTTRVASAGTETRYRAPLLGFAAAADDRFETLANDVVPGHKLPEELLSGAKSVVSFFLPFAREVVEANRRTETEVAREWAVAYTETNALIERVAKEVIDALAREGVRAVSEPPTGRFDSERITSDWSHKSVGLIAGLGSFGIHRMLITAAGCAGRFGSVVVDCELPALPVLSAGEFLHLTSGTCLVCVGNCPVGALGEDGSLDRRFCR